MSVVLDKCLVIHLTSFSSVVFIHFTFTHLWSHALNKQLVSAGSEYPWSLNEAGRNPEFKTSLAAQHTEPSWLPLSVSHLRASGRKQDVGNYVCEETFNKQMSEKSSPIASSSLIVWVPRGPKKLNRFL